MSDAAVVHGETHPGLVHPRNEDAFLHEDLGERGLLLLLCDGMGGMGRGDLASRMAIEELSRALRPAAGSTEQQMQRALCDADVAIRAALCSGTEGWAGSTAVVTIVRDGVAYVAWAGDSRVYHVRARRAVARTKDHKLVQELVDLGQITAAEAQRSSIGNVVTRSLGARPPSEPPLEPELVAAPWVLEPGDVLVLCSDGLSDLVADDEIAVAVSDHEPRQAAIALVDVALARGGHDNVTVVVARWDGVRADAPAQAQPQTVPVSATPSPLLWVGLALGALALLAALAWSIGLFG